MDDSIQPHGCALFNIAQALGFDSIFVSAREVSYGCSLYLCYGESGARPIHELSTFMSS